MLSKIFKQLDTSKDGYLQIEEIEESGVRYRNGEDTFKAEADTVVLTTGLVDNPTLADQLKQEGLEPIVVGDCSGVSYIEGAIHEGFQAALALGTNENNA